MFNEDSGVWKKNLESLDPKVTDERVDLDLAVYYISEELAWKVQAFGAPLAALTNTDCQKRKSHKVSKQRN